MDEIVEDVAVLQLEGGDDGHHALGKAAARLAPGSEAAFAPQDRGTQVSFAKIVRGLYAIGVNEGPHRGLHVEDLAAHA